MKDVVKEILVDVVGLSINDETETITLTVESFYGCIASAYRRCVESRAVIEAHETSRPTDAEVPDVIKFLLGEGKLDGFNFGEFPDNGEKYKRRYWWRKALREAWDSRALTASRPAVDLAMVLGALKYAHANMQPFCSDIHVVACIAHLEQCVSTNLAAMNGVSNSEAVTCAGVK